MTLPVNNVYNGDCLDVMRNIADKSVDMILCDLPYGATNNKWDNVISLDELWDQYKRIIKPNCAIVLTAQGLFTARLIMSNDKWFRTKFAWVKSNKTNFFNAQKKPLRQHEDIIVFSNGGAKYYPVMSKGKPYERIRKGTVCATYSRDGCSEKPATTTVSNGTRYPTDVLYCDGENPRSKDKLHPTQKPIDLGKYLIRMYSKQGDTVLDNACGSGSFVVAAKMEGRQYIGIDTDVNYCDVTRKRLDNVGADDVQTTKYTKRKQFVLTDVNEVVNG